MMQEMFSSATRLFYNSADMMELKAIVPEIYVPFIVGLFEKCKRRIGPADVEKSITCSRGIHISVRSCPVCRKKKLLEKDIITETNKVFSVTDKLFSMWIARIYGGFPII